MNHILVTGGSGLVGCALQRTLQCTEHENYKYTFVSSSDYDLTSMAETRKMFEKHSPNYVIHLAACVGGLYKNMNNKVQMLEDNVDMNSNIVKCCHIYKVNKLIACLSTCIFPDKTTYPIDETMIHDGPPHHSNDAYAYAKRMLHIQCKAYREKYNDKFICIIPTNIYGPNDNFNLEDGHVLPSLIHRCYLAKEKGIDFEVKGTGSPLRQFIYVDDVADLIMWTLKNYDDESLILSVPEKDEVSIREVATSIAEKFDYADRIVFDDSFSDGQYKKTSDNSLLMNKIGYYKFTTLEDGLTDTVSWFKRNYYFSRK